MTLQVLIATMHRETMDILNQMHIQSDAIVCNQCDRNALTEYRRDGHRVLWLDSTGRGLARNRNFALLLADADIVILADDDVVYDDGYAERICDAFRAYPDADVILFDIRGAKGHIPRTMRIRWYNSLRWGSVRMAFRLQRIHRCGIAFHLWFGAGTPRGYGEDTLFLNACLRRGLTVLAVPVTIASLADRRPSTWFRGYDAVYLQNKGLLLRELSPRFAWLLCLQDAIRHRRLYHLPWYRAYRLMRGRADE